MAFVEGVANSYADLLTAIETAMLANGWTKSGAVLHADGCFVEIAVVGTTLTLRGGAGLTGSNALQDPGPNVVRIGNSGTIMQMVFPAVYHIALHASPREVYLHVNYGVDRWQWLAFGLSGVQTPGPGCWYSGSFGGAVPSTLKIQPWRSDPFNAAHFCPGLFWGGSGSTHLNGFISTGIDVAGWRSVGYGHSVADGDVAIPAPLQGLFDRQPSQLSGAAVLLPSQVWQSRSGNTASLVADFINSRVLRIDNLAPGQVISYGPDRWRIYPFFRKNALERDGGSFSGSSAPHAHTGTMGMAVRYDGP